ncbi:MAG: PAS domain-containing protein [Myxococcales bacterium]
MIGSSTSHHRLPHWSALLGLGAAFVALAVSATRSRGALLGMVAVGVLVVLWMARTLRKKEAGEHQALETFRSLLDAAPIGVAAVDRTGRVTAWNREAERLFGWTSQEVLGNSAPIEPPETAAEFRRACLGAGHVAATSAQLRRRDGTLIRARINTVPLLGPEGRPGSTAVTFEDIGEQLSEEAARTKMIAILEASPDLLCTADSNGRVTYLNPAGRALLGLRKDTDAGSLTFPNLVPDALLGRTLEEIVPTVSRAGYWRGPLALLRADRTNVPVQQIMLGHRGEDGRIDSYSIIARDLRAQLEHEHALRRAEENLRQAQRMDAVGRLAGGIAHDFNNLITIMLGASGLALERLSKEHPARAEVLQIQQVSERAAALTGQLLSFSRKQSQETRVLDLNSLLVELDDMLHRVLGERIRLERSLAPNLGHVRADKGLLEQVIVNLVVNARDAMSEGGVLQIETGNVNLGGSMDDREDGEREAVPGLYVRLSVRDTGTGMGSQTQARAFEPFFSTKAPGKGTGLGLATVCTIVEQSGGFLSLRSVKGEGTTFHVYLPRASETGEAASRAPEEQPLPPGNETVLVAEDEGMVRELIERMLSAHGYHVLAASSAEDAIALSDAWPHPVHLLLSDVVMPGKSGPELARELKRSRPALRVVFMSGYPEQARMEVQLSDVGHTPMLPKPFPPGALVRQVREALDGAPSAERASN